MKRILLDTNVYRRLYDADSDLIEKIEKSQKIFMSPIVLGELFSGFRKGNREQQNMRWLEKFCGSNSIEVIEIGEETAKHYALIKEGLEKKGKPIPTNDIWIAAQAMENGAVLVTNDGHFEEVAGLRVWGIS